MVQTGWGPPPVGTAHGAVVRGRTDDDLPHWAELQSARRPHPYGRRAQRAQSAGSRKNARITSVPWNPDSVGGRIIYRRPWSARRNDCLLLTHIISMSLSAYSLGSTVVGGFCLRQLRAHGCPRMSIVIRLSGGQQGPQGARH